MRISIRPDRPDPSESSRVGLRVCMFVMNNCAHDPRVLKEAMSLHAAGHTVQIVAVLDKRTTPVEVRDGVTIVRIDRNPPHYRLLRFSRRVRRWCRLTWARTRRSGRRLMLRAKHRLTRVTSSYSAIRARARGRFGVVAAARALPRTARSGAERARTGIVTSVRNARVKQATRRAERLSTEIDPTPAGEAPAASGGLGIARVYRALRWRILKRSRLAYRLYYGHRTRRKRRRVRRARAAGARVAALTVAPGVEGEIRAEPPSRPLAEVPPSPAAIAPEDGVAAEPASSAHGRMRATLSRGLHFPAAALRWTERRISHIAYRAVMTLHRPLMHIDYYVRAFKAIRHEEFDVYHAHDLNTLPVAAALARANNGRLVYDSHELYPEISTLSEKERAIWRLVERRLIRRADQVITVCESIAGELSERYDVPRPMVLLNCPRSADAPQQPRPAALRERIGMRGDARAIVLYQGGLAPNRGLEEFVEAGRWIDGGVIVLMGEGRLEDELFELIRKRRLSDSVILSPAVEPHLVIPFATGADVGVIPYKGVGLNNYYTTPNKLFDYMAAGIPIAGSRFPEIVRFVEGLGIGATFDPENPREIAYTINHLIGDPASLHEMRERAAAASHTYDWRNEERKLLSIYGGLPAPSVLRAA